MMRPSKYDTEMGARGEVTVGITELTCFPAPSFKSHMMQDKGIQFPWVPVLSRIRLGLLFTACFVQSLLFLFWLHPSTLLFQLPWLLTYNV